MADQYPIALRILFLLIVIFSISLKAEVAEMKEKSRMAGGRYIQNQQLEEIRLKEDNFDRTMKKWMADKDQREKETKAEEERIQMERVSNITFVRLFLVKNVISVLCNKMVTFLYNLYNHRMS